MLKVPPTWPLFKDLFSLYPGVHAQVRDNDSNHFLLMAIANLNFTYFMESTVVPFTIELVFPKVKMYDIPSIEKARRIIESNITDHWSLPILAAKVGINECKLKSGFKHLYKTTPYHFLIGLRLRKAEDLLECTHLTIQEIADRVGFENYRGLNKAFKKWHGILPTEYRSRLDFSSGKTARS